MINNFKLKVMKKNNFYITNYGLGHNEHVVLLHISGQNYMCIDVELNSNRINTTYKLGQIVSMHGYEISETQYNINESPLYNPLFELMFEKISSILNNYKIKAEDDLNVKFNDEDYYTALNAKIYLIDDILDDLNKLHKIK